MPKHLTNIQIVKRLMEQSPQGIRQTIFNQTFIMEAIRRYADQCTSEEGKASLRESMKTGFIGSEVWIGTAEEIKQRINEMQPL